MSDNDRYRVRRELALGERTHDDYGGGSGGKWRVRGGITAAAMAVFGFAFNFGTHVMSLLLMGGETTTQLLFDFSNDPWGALLFTVGLVGIILLGLATAFHWVQAATRPLAGGFIVLFVLAAVGFLIASGTAQVPSSVTQAPPAAALAGYIVGTSLEPGCSVNTITNTMTCDVVYNTTSNYFAVSSSNASTCNYYGSACHPRNYLNFEVHQARTDSLNATYGFAFVIATIPTVTTSGANPTVYSPVVGYVAATSTATGYWLVKQNAGSLNGQDPSQAAPGSTSSIGSSTVGITAFGSVSDTWNTTLPGAGGSSAPTSLYAALTLYGSYSMTFQVSNASPQTYTLTVIVIGEHA